jgi:hypothetical protein
MNSFQTIRLAKGVSNLIVHISREYFLNKIKLLGNRYTLFACSKETGYCNGEGVNEDASIQFSDIPPGKYNISVSVDDKKQLIIADIEVKEGQTTKLED